MELIQTDPEFAAFFEHFAENEVPNEAGQELDPTTRHMAILAVLLGCQGVDEFTIRLKKALDDGFSPVMAKELTYQATAYLGMGRVKPFLAAINEVLTERGIALPLAAQATTTPETRLEKGAQAQVDIFGDGMRDFWTKGHMNRWLAANCFGDYYTRGGLSLAQRELCTFCYLYAQGGCEPQLSSHIAGNIRMGNDAALLSRVVSQCVPYIGYPRSLNALACIRKATEAQA